MRKEYKSTKEAGKPSSVLTPERIKILEEVGFEWSLVQGIKFLTWEERYADLVKFHEVHGHANVVRSYKEDPSLGEWVHVQSKSLIEGLCK